MARDWVEVTECPVCTWRGLEFYKLVNSPPRLDVEFCGGKLPMLALVSYVECRKCGLIIQSPRMTDERIDLYYSSGVYRATQEISVEDMDRGEVMRADTAAEWLQGMGILPIESHLDIGCSRGSFLKRVNAAQKYGLDTNHEYGVESFTVIRETAAVVPCELVSALHVLEHVTDPLGQLKTWRAWSTKYVLIEVPRPDSGLRFPHLYYFPVKVLEEMFKKAKLKIIALIDYPNTRILAEVL